MPSIALLVDHVQDRLIFSLHNFVLDAINEELREDVPKLWEYLAQTLGRILSLSRHSNIFELRDFAELILEADGFGKDILAHTLLAVVR